MNRLVRVFHIVLAVGLVAAPTAKTRAVVVRAPFEPAGQDAAAQHLTSADVSTTRLHVRLARGASLHCDEGIWVLRASPTAAGLTLASVLGPAEGWTVGPGVSVKPTDAQLAASLGLNRDVLITLAAPGDTVALATSLAGIPAIESAEPEAIGTLLTTGTRLPTDPLIGQQYALENSGQVILGMPGVPGVDTRAIDAWTLVGPLHPVTVAVIDSGIAGPHPDLAPALTTGWNVVANNAQTGDEIVSHGTHVAGIIGAAHNNWGVAGLCPAARLMPVKVTNNYGSTGAGWVASGVIWAADHGARVLNLSIGLPADNAVLRSAIQYAAAKGCVIVCSAGNTPGGPVSYPARYPEVLAVGAIDNRNLLWPQSATGAELDLVAPGVGVLSTWHKAATPSTHEYRDGTSQAAPQVAGVAALVWGAEPTLTAGQVRLILEVSARDMGPRGWDPYFGHGCVDAGRAVELARIFANPTAPAKGSCRVDVNRDGVVTSADFYLFLTWYLAGDPRADFAAPAGVISSEDFFRFASEYASGCVRL